MPKMIGVSKAAREMNISEQAVRELCKSGNLPSARQRYKSGPWEISQQSVDEWIANSQIASSEQKREIVHKKLTKWISSASAIILFAIAAFSFIGDWGGIRSQLVEWGIWRNFPRASQDEILIVVFTFYRTEGVIDTNIQGEIQRAIQEAADEYKFKNIRVEIEPRQVRTDEIEKVAKIAANYRASIVIWGENSGTRVTVNFVNTRFSENAFFYSINETKHTQIADPSAYAQFVTDDLPSRLSFLSIFTLSQSYISVHRFTDATYLMEIASAYAEEKQVNDEMYYPYINLGWLYAINGDREKAIAAIEKSIQLKPDSAKVYINSGIVHILLRNFSGALKDLQKAAIIDPSNPLVFHNLGLAYYLNGDLDKAVSNYSSALSLDPSLFIAYINRGNIYDDQGNDQLALNDYEAAIHLEPKSPSVYINRAIVYQQNPATIQLALADFAHAIELDPSYLPAYQFRGNLFEQLGKYEEAIQDYTTIIDYIGDQNFNVEPDTEGVSFLFQDNPVNLSKAYFYRGNVYFDQKQFQMAIDDFTKSIENYKPFTIDDCKKFMDIMPCSEDPKSIIFYDQQLADIYGLRGRAKRYTNDLKGAEIDYTSAIQNDPFNPVHLNNRGNVLRELGQIQQALDDLNKAIEFDPGNGTFYVNRAIILFDLKRYADVISDCEKAKELTPANAEIFYWRGKAYIELGDKPQAVQNLKKYLELKPNAFDKDEIEKLINELSLS